MKIRTLTVGILETNCYILSDEASKTCAVIDPGAEAPRILSAAAGFRVEYILLTHGHFDHILAAAEICRQTGAKLYLHKADERLLTPEYVAGYGWVRTPYEQPPVAGYLEDAAGLSLGSLKIQVLHTPGHSEGSCVFLCGDAMFSGDTLFLESWGRCDLDGGSERKLAESLRKLAALPGDCRVFPGHGESTTLEYERRHNGMMRS